MKWAAALLMLTLGAPSAASEMVLVNLTGTPDGQYVLTISSGAVTLQKATILEINPTPPPPPAPSTLTERGKAVKGAAEAVVGDANRDRTAQQLATIYREVAKKVLAGELKGQQTIAMVISGSTDMVLSQAGVKTNWQKPRAVVSDYWAKLATAGAADAEFAKLLNEAADGFAALAQAPQAIDMKTILAIIQMILELIQKLFPSGVPAGAGSVAL